MAHQGSKKEKNSQRIGHALLAGTVLIGASFLTQQTTAAGLATGGYTLSARAGPAAAPSTLVRQAQSYYDYCLYYGYYDCCYYDSSGYYCCYYYTGDPYCYYYSGAPKQNEDVPGVGFAATAEPPRGGKKSVNEGGFVTAHASLANQSFPSYSAAGVVRKGTPARENPLYPFY